MLNAFEVPNAIHCTLHTYSKYIELNIPTHIIYNLNTGTRAEQIN